MLRKPKLLGMNLGKSDFYDSPAYQAELSRADVLVLGFWRTWKDYIYGPNSIGMALSAIKELNPDIKIGQYTVLNEAALASDPDNANIDVANKLDAEGWWLRDAAGQQVQWTTDYNKYDINSTAATPVDSSGKRFPEWYAERNFNIFFQDNPDFTFWYLDNSWEKSQLAQADWLRNGTNQTNTDSALAYRLGNVAYWDTIKALQPNTMLLANTTSLQSSEYIGKLNGAFIEAAIGADWSIETTLGWDALLAHYFSFMENTIAPHYVGFNVWGTLTDYKTMRYGLCTCLLHDGYFTYSDVNNLYRSFPLFDEFEVGLGLPIDTPTLSPYVNGIHKRVYEHGIVLVNPTLSSQNITLTGYRKFNGIQDPITNSGELVSTITIPSKDGIILINR